MFKIKYERNLFPAALVDLTCLVSEVIDLRRNLLVNITQIHALPLTSKCTTGAPQPAEHQLYSEIERHWSARYLQALLPQCWSWTIKLQSRRARNIECGCVNTEK